MNCVECNEKMVEKPLFSSTYWECTPCEARARLALSPIEECERPVKRSKEPYDPLKDPLRYDVGDTYKKYGYRIDDSGFMYLMVQAEYDRMIEALKNGEI